MNTCPAHRLWSGATLLLLATQLSGYAADPLDQWQWRNPLPSGNGLEAVRYGNGMFVAVGDGGTILSSTDTTNWTSRYLGSIYGAAMGYTLSSIAWGAGTWTAVGGGQPPGGGSFPVIVTSTDLATWAQQSAPSNSSFGVSHLDRMIYDDGQFIAVGGGGNPEAMQPMAAILTSPDGVHWSHRDSGTDQTSWMGLAYGNGVFLAVGLQGGTLRSTDGANWSFYQTAIPISPGLAFGDGRFVALTGGPAYSSPDGLAWSRISSLLSASWLMHGGGQFVATDGARIWTSPDATNWTGRGLATTGHIWDIAYGEGKFVAVGSGALSVSTNGSRWLNLAAAVTTTLINAATYGEGSFVAVGDQSTILRSADGAKWTRIAAGSPSAPDLYAAAYGGGTFVAVGSRGLVLVSTNGIDWSSATNTGDTLLPDVIYANGQFLAVGSNGTILTSADGSVWRSTGSQDLGPLAGVAYGDGLYVVGNGTGVLTSPDAMHWSEPETIVTNFDLLWVKTLAYGGGRFIAAGYGGHIWDSTNAVDWVPVNSGTSADLYHAAYANGTFLVVGDAGTILSSTNGTDWISHDAGTMNYLSGAAYGNNTFVVVGVGGTILQSAELAPVGARLSAVPGWSPGGFGLTLSAPAAGQWEIEGSTDLLNWTALGSLVGTSVPSVFIDRQATNLSRRFYRAVGR